MNKLKLVRDVLVVGWFLVAAKLYSEMQYYQGRIDANEEFRGQLDILIKDMEEKMDQKEEGV